MIRGASYHPVGGVIAALVMLAGMASAATKGDRAVDHSASGEFDVQLTPNAAADAAVGSMTIRKTFHGDLAGSSSGQMLSVLTPVDGSAGYVAMERVTGTLGGKQGTFALQHSGTMDKGAQTLSVSVVPDSATGDLGGLTGSMTIKIEGGKHFYTFRYALPQ